MLSFSFGRGIKHHRDDHTRAGIRGLENLSDATDDEYRKDPGIELSLQ